MGILPWLQQSWFELIESAANGAELFNHRRERLYQTVTNHIVFTQRHGELWRRYAADSQLHRIKNETVDLAVTPIALKEHQFVSEVINHLSDCFNAYDNGVFKMPEAIDVDIKTFFALPIPKAVWNNMKIYHDRKFVTFVDKQLQDGLS
jgi:hypothetical protein